MEKTRQNGEDLKPSIEVQCEVLDLSTKRLPSATPNSSSSSSLPYSCPSSPPNKTRHRSTSVTCSTPIIPSEVDSRYSTTRTAATTLTDAPHRTFPRALPGTGTETTYSVGSISPGHARASNDNLLREQTKDALRFVRRVDYSPFSFAQLHGVSPVTHTRAPHFEMPPSIASFPFNAAAVAAAAAVSPFIRGFPGLGQPLLTDVGSTSLPLQGSSVHPHMDFASTAAATAFPSYLHRRRRRGQRSSDPTTTPCSPHLSQPLSGLQHSTGPRATDDDCSRESANGRPASSRNSERSHSEEKDPAYLERRRKNNEAAKRSRDARRQKEEEIAARAATLEQENITLKAELLLLRRESAELHSLLYGRVDPQR